ncbi:MAG: DUF4397 domain-containing protein [bacterium]|nr:DUF4397 domain-containing protein [bacterium]
MKMKLKVMGVLFLFGVFSLLILSSCVDMPTDAVTPPSALSYYRFIHAAEGAGNVSLSVDGKSIGALDFKGNTPYAEYAAGKKTVVLSTGDTLVMSMATDYRGTMCILLEEGKPTFLRANEMRIFDPVTAEKGKLRVIHLSTDAQAANINATGPDELEWTSVAYKTIGAYKDATPGQYTVTVTPVGETDAVLTFTVTVGTERSTAFIVGSVAGGTLSAVALKDN